MKRLIGLLTMFFIISASQAFAKTTNCEVGKQRAGGGYVFSCENGEHGREAALSDISQHTIEWSIAKAFCENYGWSLPTVRDLMDIDTYLKKASIGNFAGECYWSNASYYQEWTNDDGDPYGYTKAAYYDFRYDRAETTIASVPQFGRCVHSF